jgi:hypothetical protein
MQQFNDSDRKSIITIIPLKLLFLKSNRRKNSCILARSPVSAIFFDAIILLLDASANVRFSEFRFHEMNGNLVKSYSTTNTTANSKPTTFLIGDIRI